MTLYLRDTDLAERYSISRSTVQLAESCTRWRLDEIERRDSERDVEAA